MLDKVINKLKHLKAKHYIQHNEKEFSSGNHRIKYLFSPCQGSSDLIVVFSAFPGSGKKAGYNMVSTFGKAKINKLYILDDFGYMNRGSYYLSENGDFYVRELTIKLIERFSENMTRRTFLGSSKGGYAALYFGLLLGADAILAGAPQYYLGNYLTSKPEHIPILDAMAGNHDAETAELYNNLMKKLITAEETDRSCSITIHYSKQEPTYEAHIKDMLKCLKENNYKVAEDVAEYKNHGDVSGFFPALCLNIIKKTEGKKND
ncbi:MAG: hypothetical protein J6N52_04870 [Clostridia bacterium]|nr:hypothetical protein [Clostridia bacterium]